ncbi:hypothetical protein SAMN05446037_100875 [Anaerovirgula multivorans]|uniref:Uncharacterized protein n=1 Tax=Anaerovirgula multivorans TaxID=312168 RepID=A0A239DRX6_9FIRM|nr:hypothetical protein [Anaerovirgula multivorans]SNS34324.1 hypothetical protein SAMN05446037_100875 [Anaerovirgula multivorans]
MSKRKTAIIICMFIFILVFLHSMSTLALRTSVFLHGYPIVALTTTIQEYEPYDQYNRELLQKENSRLYKLTPPPIEKATDGYLYTWKVNKKGYLYFASYYGEA